MNPQYNFENVAQHPPPSSYQRQTESKAGEAPARPMSAIKGSGFPASSAGNRAFDPLNQGNQGATAAAKPLEVAIEEQYTELEKEVHQYIEKSASAKIEGKLNDCLEHAKEAAAKERNLRRQRETAGLIDQINIDLTYSVCFNLANAYQLNGMIQEALNTYALIVRNKQYPQAGRLRVNMGNIYYKQKKFSTAIKMYRMALDLVPKSGREMRFQIMKNIAHSFVKLGQYHDAIQSYESIMEGSPDFQTGYNLILCYYALGDAEKMKKGFIKLLSIEIPGEEDEEDEDPKYANDSLAEYIKEKRREAFKFISDAAKLIANLIEDDWEAGYDWILEQLQAADFQVVESDIEIHKAVEYMKMRNFDKAIEVFKSFEKKDRIQMARASTNISFLYFIERDWSNAEKYADMAIKNDRYNAKALVNKGNCLFVNEDFEKAKEYYLEAIGVEADCVEAIYNLGLVNRHIGQEIEALQAFEKLQTILTSSPEVMFQMATIYERVGDIQQALKWYSILSTQINSDPGILLRMGQLYSAQNDESQAFHYYNESFRHLPTIEAISWLGVFYVKNEFYEKAVQYFERACDMQPEEVKWKLMVASCHRRMGNSNHAMQLYESINEQYPDNVDCLQYLVSICQETGQRYDHYQAQLVKLKRAQEMDAQDQPQEDMYDSQPPAMSAQPPMSFQQPPPMTNPGGLGPQGYPAPAVMTEQPKNLPMRPGSSRRPNNQVRGGNKMDENALDTADAMDFLA